MSEEGEDEAKRFGDKPKEQSQQAQNQEELLRERYFADSFDHLSQYDPDDQLIKSERSYSIIESFMAKDSHKRGSDQLSETSEFSIITSKHLKSQFSSILGAPQSTQSK